MPHLSRASPASPSSTRTATVVEEARGTASLPSITQRVLGRRWRERAGLQRPPGGPNAHTWRPARYTTSNAAYATILNPVGFFLQG